MQKINKQAGALINCSGSTQALNCQTGILLPVNDATDSTENCVANGLFIIKEAA